MNKILAISGGSGSGKSTILQALDGTNINRNPITVITSLTTRPLRYSDELYRRSVSEKEFESMQPGMAQCIRFGDNVGGNRYGIMAADIDEALVKGHVLVDVVAEGVVQLQNYYPHTQVLALFLYVRPRILLQRLLERSSPHEDIKYRMTLSAQQLKDAIDADFYAFIENANMESTIQSIKDLLMGKPVKTIAPDYEGYLCELKEMAKEVMAQWETANCAP